VTHLRLELADIVRDAGPCFVERSRRWISWQHQKVLLAITRCCTRTRRPSISSGDCRLLCPVFDISSEGTQQRRL
jgi:hypothetical protein